MTPGSFTLPGSQIPIKKRPPLIRHGPVSGQGPANSPGPDWRRVISTLEVHVGIQMAHVGSRKYEAGLAKMVGDGEEKYLPNQSCSIRRL